MAFLSMSDFTNAEAEALIAKFFTPPYGLNTPEDLELTEYDREFLVGVKIKI